VSGTKVSMNSKPPDDDRSIGQLVASATRDMSDLVRGEIALAKAELRQAATSAAKGGALFVVAGLLGYVAIIILSAAAALGLTALGLHPAVGFAAIGGAQLVVCAILAYAGMRNLRKARPPERTKHTLEQTKQVVARASDGR